MSFQAPLVHELSRAAIEVVLRRNGVGRLAYVLEDRVEVEPIHFAFADGWIYGRTAQGARLRTVQHDRMITFHVDEVDGVLAWRSIVGRGLVTLLPLDPTAQERAQWQEGLAAIHQFESSGHRTSDDVAPRGTAFRILLVEVVGQGCGETLATTAWEEPADLAAAPWPSYHDARFARRPDAHDSAHP